MTDEYRQKLLNWLCSVILILAASAMSSLFYWFVTLSNVEDITPPQTVADFAGPFGESMLVYPIIFPMIFFWHFWDFVQAEPAKWRWGERLSRYPAFLLLIVVAATFYILMATGLFTINSCDELEGALFHECYISLPYWLIFPFFITMGFLLVLSLLKMTISLISHIQRPKK